MEEKYLKIIDGALFNGSNITPRIASEIVFFVKKMVSLPLYTKKLFIKI
jgi:hypothetical protein